MLGYFSYKLNILMRIFKRRCRYGYTKQVLMVLKFLNNYPANILWIPFWNISSQEIFKPQ
jgi:hypothetical protein